MGTEDVAKICHEANRAYCQANDDYSQPEWADAPDWQRGSATNGVEFHLVALRRGDKPLPSASHESWLAEKVAAGWVYGPEKDPTAKTHPCCVPYSQLPTVQKAKDYIFAGIVESCYRAGVIG